MFMQFSSCVSFALYLIIIRNESRLWTETREVGVLELSALWNQKKNVKLPKNSYTLVPASPGHVLIIRPVNLHTNLKCWV